MSTYQLGTHTVKRMGYGAMQLAGKGVFGPPRDRDEAIRVLHRAVELGVDHIDTSQYYGPNVVNEVLHEALHPFDGIAVVSKVGARRDETGGWLPWDAPDELRQGIEDNLRCLDIPSLAAVNLRLMDHAPADRLEAQVAALVQARDEGLIDGIGVSNVSLDQLTLLSSLTDLVCVQNPYNYVDRSSQPVLEACLDKGIAFVPFFPLGSGFGIADVRGNPAVVAEAERLGITPTQAALSWTLNAAPNVLLIPGTSSVAHLEENLAAADVEGVQLP